jgi:hypothetical protein
VHAGFGVYLGTMELKDGPFRVCRSRRFLEEVEEGDVRR